MNNRTCRIGFRLICALLAATLVCACNLTGQPADQAPIATGHVNITIVATTGAISTPSVASVATSVLAPLTNVVTPTTAPVSGECPITNPNTVAPQKPQTFADTPTAIMSYLNAGASADALISLLESWGDITTLPDKPEQAGGVVAVRMIAGNDAQIAVTYIGSTQTQGPSRRGDILVLGCSNGSYAVIYQASADQEIADRLLNPRILSDADVTGDGVGDLSVSLTDCGADTCYSGIVIFSSVHGAIHNIIPAFTWVPSPTFEFASSNTGGGTGLPLYVHEGYLSSAGAGPQRAVTDTWLYNREIFTYTTTTREPPVYRIHALQDADAAFRRNDLATANTLYRRVINDASLQSYQGNAPLRDEAQILGAFASFRLMQTAASAGDQSGMQNAYDSLSPAAGGKTPAALYADMADAFIAAYQQSRNYRLACDAVVKFAQKNQNVYLVLGQDTFGSTNYNYQATDMCIVP